MNWPERIFSTALGILFLAISFQKVIYMRGAMMKKGPPTATATPIGRASFFLLGVVLVFVGLTGITEFWQFKP